MKLKKINKFQISIDGGGSTGTSTGGKLISKKYGLTFLSSGLLYRYASYQIIKNKPNSVVSLKKIVDPSWTFISLNLIFFSDSPGL